MADEGEREVEYNEVEEELRYIKEKILYLEAMKALTWKERDELEMLRRIIKDANRQRDR